MIELKSCLCGRSPQLIFWDRDRDLHPSILHARYSCGNHGHIIAAPWFDLSLTGIREDPRMADGAATEWNNFLGVSHDQR